jgi:hypothetical protein
LGGEKGSHRNRADMLDGEGSMEELMRCFFVDEELHDGDTVLGIMVEEIGNNMRGEFELSIDRQPWLDRNQECKMQCVTSRILGKCNQKTSITVID